MYFRKPTAEILNPPELATRADVGFRTERFTFLDRLEKRKWPELARMIRPATDVDHGRLVAEVIAASVAKLHAVSLTSNGLIEEGLRYLLDLMAVQGYAELSDHSLRKNLSNDPTRKVVVVVGCQTEEILESRVKRAYELARVVGDRATIVLSGKCPNRPRVRIANESERMAGILERLIDQRGTGAEGRVPYIQVVLENKSDDTKANVREILDHPDVFDTSAVHTVFMVSSTFHLPRLAVCFEEVLRTKADLATRINHVIFSHSEEAKATRLTRRPEYVKATLFEIYWRIVDESVAATAAD